MKQPRARTRLQRLWIVAAAFVAVAVQGVGVGAWTARAQRVVTPPLPACAPNLAATPSQTEGPFYKSNTPERTSLLEPGMPGTRIIVTGYVLAG